jgi:hypothetical protein
MKLKPPLRSSGQSSWLQSQRSGLDSQRYQIFWEVVGLQRGPLSLVWINRELFQGNSGSGLGGLQATELWNHKLGSQKIRGSRLQSTTGSVFGYSNNGIVGSNPTLGMMSFLLFLTFVLSLVCRDLRGWSRHNVYMMLNFIKFSIGTG